MQWVKLIFGLWLSQHLRYFLSRSLINDHSLQVIKSLHPRIALEIGVGSGVISAFLAKVRMGFKICIHWLTTICVSDHFFSLFKQKFWSISIIEYWVQSKYCRNDSTLDEVALAKRECANSQVHFLSLRALQIVALIFWLFETTLACYYQYACSCDVMISLKLKSNYFLLSLEKKLELDRSWLPTDGSLSRSSQLALLLSLNYAFF